MFLSVEKDDLKEIVESHPKVFAMFGASWCGNCRLLKPKVKKKAQENDAVTYVYVDAENSPMSREMAEVTNLPTFAIYYDGRFVNQVTTSKEEKVKELNDEITNL